jgi:hypothetical protein
MSTSTTSGGSNQEVPGGSPDPKTVTPEPKPNTVSHETFSKVLDEKKSLQERLKAYEAKEKETAEKNGEFERLYREEVAQREKIANDAREEKARFALSSVRSQLQAEAAKLGVSRFDVLEKLVDLNSLAKETDSNFQVKPEAMKSLLEKTQKENDFLFKKEAAGFRDAPAGGKPAADKSLQEELAGCKTQAQLDAVMKKRGLA